MKTYLPFAALTLAPLVAFAACDSGPCENTGSCGDYPGGAAGTSGTTSTSSGGGNGTGGRGGTSSGGVTSEAGAAGGPANGGAAGGGNEAGAGGESGGAGGAGGAPSTCDVTQSPSTEPCLVSDEFAMFVAPTGDDSSSGTQDAPVKSLSRALELATLSGKLVIVCNARFDEQLVLTSGARVYGGFACPTEDTPWLYAPGTRTEVKPVTEGAALIVQGVLDPVVIEDLDFASMTATRAGSSSIGASIVNSPDVTLRRTRITAGSAAAGANGAKGANGPDGDLPLSDQRGGDAVCGAQAPATRDGGRWLAANACGSRGGAGGQAQQGDLGFPGASGTPQINVVPEAVNNGGSAAPATPANAPGGA
ncbi:MAG TPA: hypothetical protein VFQ35_08540, partial [Polyangiaceae bacterium]|nr:hypothetical protein [Polyangiaceae bacterium]